MVDKSLRQERLDLDKYRLLFELAERMTESKNVISSSSLGRAWKIVAF